ncbi:fructose-bisphosphate aldolase, class II [[Clostridium] methylpentosum DSM 5476]|uniref:Fructose-bisphosphate aldolase n=1 Tax=[Clostridium] methylpentosum DSM 5476 TaxID=537013 RepID=C0E8I9_9FIRM|nr:fructose-bisphosphate aldolase, class II [[Clostridium] methylpentosum DSM 5476]
MLDSAYKNHYAYPAFNVTSMETVSAVLAGLAEAKSDGIIQVSTGGAAHASGATVKDKVLGAIALAEYVHLVASKYDIFVALHTDHCKAEDLDGFVLPLIEETERRRAAGLPNLFNSHMFDGSNISLKENIEISKKLLARCSKNDIVLEVEAGVVGGEEDGVNNEGVANEKLYTTPEDLLKIYEALDEVGGRYMVAATFGNVHGVYKPGNVKLRPKVLLEGQEALKAKYGDDKAFQYVFHGGSGSSKEEIHETLNYGVVKMNIDTDTQYAFTRPIVEHMFKNYDGVLKVDGEVGVKKVYDPRAYLKAAEKGMSDRVIEACEDLHSVGKSLY